MKHILFSLILLLNNNPLLSQEDYQLSDNSLCKKTIYREEHVRGIPSSPGYVKAREEVFWLPCNQKKSSNINSRQIKNFQQNKKCHRTIGSLIGGSIAGALSKKDAYGWAIPLGTVIGGGIGNTGC